MNFHTYHEFTQSTAIYPSDVAKEYCALKLNGEAGEVAEKIAKVHRDNNGYFTKEKREEIAKELGDVLWYISQLAHECGYTLEEVAQMNIDKLTARKARGTLQGSGDAR